MMGNKRYVMLMLSALSLNSLFAEEIVVGIEPIPQRQVAILFTPIVIPDLISAKMAVEYRLNPKFNLIFPFEGQWMDYRWAIRLFDQEFPGDVYNPDRVIRPGWNFSYSHWQISAGLGLKGFPFSQSMTNAFFLKSTLLAGVERFNAFGADGVKDSAVITTVFSLGYNWVKGNVFTFGVEAGIEHAYHTNPIEKFPSPFSGFSPLLQFSLGFLI
ncbi:MAG TPA: hypothetical protein VEK06_04305 [Myxococcota bacterium]|nr:hypothetical protein [Myxococcota bacterium]